MTFTLAFAGHTDAVAVIGDFNDWNPTADPFTLSPDARQLQASVVLAPGRRYAFRYVRGDGHGFTEETAPAQQDDTGETTSLLDLSLTDFDPTQPPGQAAATPPAAPRTPPADLQPGGFNGGSVLPADPAPADPPPAAPPGAAEADTSPRAPGWDWTGDTDDATRVGLRPGEQPDTLAPDALAGRADQRRGGQRPH